MSREISYNLVLNAALQGNLVIAAGNVSRRLSELSRAAAELRSVYSATEARLNSGSLSQASAQASQYRQQLRQLQSQMNEIAVQQSRIRFNDSVGRTVGAFQNLKGTADTVKNMASPLVGAIETAAKFEQGMAKVKAIMGNISNEEFAKLTSQAKELGASTQFSATQASEAMSYLALAGWKANSITAAMPGLLSLAAASGEDLARVADIVSDDMTGFGIAVANADGSVAMYKDGISNAQHFADVFAYTMSNTNTTVSMLGETMKYAAPVAKAFGATLEETSALAGLMANAGIKASQAGTTLRAGFLRLAGPPKKASKAMDELGISLQQATTEAQEAQEALAALGISTTDLSGEQKKMGPLLNEIRAKTADLSKEQKLSTLATIFGTEAASGWLAVLDTSPEVFDKMVKEMENADGTSERMANTMNSTAMGSLTRIKSAIESVSIAVGEVFLPRLAEIGDAVAKAAGSFAKWAAAHPDIVSLGVSLAGIAGSAMIAVKSFMLVSETIGAVQAGIAMLRTVSATGGTTGLFSSIGGSMLTSISAAFSGFISQIQVFASLAITKFTTPFKAMAGIFKMIGGVIAENTITPFIGKISTFFSGIGGKIASLLTKVAGPIRMLFAPLIGMLSGPLTAAFGGVIASFGGLAAAALPIIGIIAGIVAAGAILYSNWDTIANVAQVVWDKVQACWGAAMERLQPAFDSIGQSLDRLGVTFSSFGGQSSILETIFNTLGSVITAAFMVGITAIEVFVNAFAGAFEIISVTVNEIGVIIQAVAEGDWSAAWNSMGNIVSTVVSGIISTVSNMVSSVINGVKSIMGLSPGGGGGEGVDISSNAYGGIYKQGAFLTTFAEDGPEAAIPLDGGSRGRSLWEQAGEIGGYSTSSSTNNSYNISIPVNISGSVDNSAVGNITSQIESAVRRALENIEHNNRRVSFA